MKNILWLFLFSMLMSPESFGTLASSESDIQTLLSAGRSSFIAGKIREVLRSRLDSGPLTSDKIRKLIQSPQVAALCCLHQFSILPKEGNLSLRRNSRIRSSGNGFPATRKYSTCSPNLVLPAKVLFPFLPDLEYQRSEFQSR